MRVTQSMLQNNMLDNLFKSQAKMDKYLTQINTGKKISKPSDNPVIAMKGIGYRTEVREVEQYTRNTSEVWGWFDQSDDVLGKATSAMQRMEELAIQAANGSNSESELDSIAEEVKQLKEQMVEFANTKVNGKYIFNGTDTDKKPVSIDDEGNVTIEEATGRKEAVEIEVAKDINMSVNVSPEELFDESLFENIDSFIGALENGDKEELNESVGNLQDSSSQIIKSRAELGARMNRLELIEDRLSHQGIIAEDTMKKNEGVEFEEAVTNLLTEEVIHRAALAAGSKIIQPSLIDFLR